MEESLSLSRGSHGRLLLLFCCCLLLPLAAFAEKIALLADLHVSPGNNNAAALPQAVAEINNSDCDFVMVAGDITNTGAQNELLAVSSALKELRKPYIIVPGNHETNWSPSAGQDYHMLWGAASRLFKHGNIALISFDSGPFMRMGDGMVPPDMIAAREKDLKNCGGKLRLALAHYPPNSGELSNAADLLAALRRSGVRGFFCGHHHTLKLAMWEGLPTLYGRALWNGRNFGYTIVDIDGDQVKAFDKALGVPVGKAAITYRLAAAAAPEAKRGEVPPPPKHFQLLRQTPEMIFSAAAADGNVVYYGTASGRMVAYDTVARRELWSYAAGGPVFSRPVIFRNLLIFGATDCHIVALNRQNGKPVWIQKANYPVAADGVLHDGAFYIGLGQKAFAKFDAASGSKLWEIDGINSYLQGAPDVADGKVVFGAWDRTLRCVDAQSGKLLWKWVNPHGARLFSPGNTTPRILEGKVIFVAPDRKITALDIAAGREIYRQPWRKVRESCGMSADRKSFYAKTMDGVLIKFAAGTAAVKELWSADLKYGYELNPCPIIEHDGLVYVAGHKGQLSVVSAADGRILRQGKLGNSAVNRLEIYDGKIYATLLSGSVWCVEK